MIEVEVLGALPAAPGAEEGAGAGGSAPAECEAPAVAEIRRLCVLAAASAGISDGHVAIEFVDAARITQLNHEYRKRPTPTDVLSFPVDGAEPIDGAEPAGAGPGAAGERSAAGGPAASRELGDVVICAEHTADLREAVIHGVLHLLGMDHETDDGEMMALQRELLASEGR
jgi:probable rRNA maturation factor